MKNLIALFVIGIFFLSAPAFASKIYKWVDSEGNTHYGERAPNHQGQQIRVPKGPTNVAAPTSNNSSQFESTKKLLDAFDKERKDKAATAAKTAKEKARRDKNCSSARRRIAGLNLGGRQFVVDEQGERKYLSEADIKTRLAEAQKVAEKWCK